MDMKIGLFAVLAAGILVTLPSCWEEQAPEKKMGFVVINVLDKQLYDDCHIKGSINVPFESIEQCTNLINTDAEIVVYCTNHMCSTSDYACKKLQELGFKKVWVYEGGTAEWYQQGLPVQGPSKSLYLTKHVDKVGEGGDSRKLPVISARELAQKMETTLAHG